MGDTFRVSGPRKHVTTPTEWPEWFDTAAAVREEARPTMGSLQSQSSSTSARAAILVICNQ
jgi:hypothetical protein